MRDIKYIVLHCTAGPAQQSTQSIKDYWAHKLGWKSYGYHYLVSADGSVELLTPVQLPTNGVKGYNANSIHVCYKGGWDGTDTRTEKQKESLGNIVARLKKEYPKAVILGHRDLSPDLDKDGLVEKNEWVKICPCFSAMEEYKDLNK